MNKAFVSAVFLMVMGLGVFAQSGVIRELSGTVEVKSPGASDYVPAKAGDSLSQDTMISTGFRSTALLEIGNALITVRPLTRLTLMEISSSAGTETLNVGLQAGRVRVDVSPPAGTKASMSVTSPIATASVRGTSFDLDTRNLYVRRGAVNFAGKQGLATRVSAGSSSRVESSGRTTYPADSKNAGLLPPSPSGGSSAGRATSGKSPNRSNETFFIRLTY